MLPLLLGQTNQGYIISAMQALFLLPYVILLETALELLVS